MQIIKEKNTNRAVLMFADDAELVLNSSCLTAPDLMVSDVSTDTHEIVRGNAPVAPFYWVAGALAYDAGTWSMFDQGTYDAMVPQAIAKATEEMRRKRAAEYPPMADYLDGIVKGDQAQVQAYIDACLAVKAKYPKPE